MTNKTSHLIPFLSIAAAMLFSLGCALDSEAPDGADEIAEDGERGDSTRGKADAPGSCEAGGENFCGKQSADGCWCDDQCVGFGDCCSDRTAVCEAPEEVPGSCEAGGESFCGGQSTDGCWCDDQCAGFGDCCEDIDAVCSEPEPEACPGTPRYRATLTTNWNAAGVPNPHWSPLVGASHGPDVDFFALGGLASAGIEEMAETGGTGPLSNEVQAAVSAGTASERLLGGPIQTASGTSSVTFDASAEFTLVTLTSMMAPSPDWFVGVSGVNLCPDGEWLTGSVNLTVLDAGTDSGTNFTSADRDTNPADPISQATRFISGGQPQVLGQLTFERID